MPAKWWYVALPAAALLTTFVLWRATGPDLLNLPEAGTPATPTIVAQLSVSPADPLVGQAVTVRAVLASDRPATVDQLVVAIQHEQTGVRFDLPTEHDFRIGADDQSTSGLQKFTEAGIYRYWIEYRVGGDTVALQPHATFTVRPG